MEPPQNTFPDEIICKILCFLSPLDVVRLRVLSKKFRNITYDPLIWKTLYANARVPLRRGPLPFQSTQFLERNLVASTRLAQTWTTQPLRDITRTDIRIRGKQSMTGEFIVVCGGWLLSCESHSRFVLQYLSLETRAPLVLFDHRDPVHSWKACSFISPAGLLIYVIFSRGDPGHRSPVSLKLMEFRIDPDSGEVFDCVSLDVPTGDSTRYSVNIFCRGGPFMYISSHRLVFDSQTRLFHKFPEFSSRLGSEFTSQFAIQLPSYLLSTNTHIVAFWIPSASVRKPALVQVFAVSADAPPGNCHPGVLRLTHEGLNHGRFLSLFLVRRPVIDPITGSTNLRFLQRRSNSSNMRLNLVEFTLPKSDSDIALPISFHVHELFKLEVNGSNHSLFDVSYDGHIRGLWIDYVTSHSSEGARRMTTSSVSVVKFSIDASEDECVVVLGEPSSPRWNHIDCLPRNMMEMRFDGVIGRILYTSGENLESVVVLDIE